MSQKKVLIFRLSSLGDVILASSVLSIEGLGDGTVDWVVSSEFAPLLRGHPRVGRLWEFDRRKGLSSWLELARKLSREGYTDILDLHSSLRTRIARFCFPWLGSPRWRRISKQRVRLWGLYLLKRRWPASWLPKPYVQRFTKLAGGTGDERPDLSHLKKSARHDAEFSSWAERNRDYFCVMPGSKWMGKCWAPEKYLEVIRDILRLGWIPVVLGGKDPGSERLVSLLNSEKIPHFSGVARWDLPQVAAVLKDSRAYLGSDTGIAHLAESLRVPALVIYGPTTPQMGFGVWQDQSRTVGLEDLGCRPCGKDGRRCYRLKQPYLCMTGLRPEQVIAQWKDMQGGAS